MADRVVLEAAPRERTVQCYLPTRAAQRILALLAARRDSTSGDFFWLGDPPAAVQENGRELVLAFDYPGPASAAQLENDILAALARELGGGERRGVPLWRRIDAVAALEVAMAEARRAGVRAITITIAMLGGLAGRLRGGVPAV